MGNGVSRGAVIFNRSVGRSIRPALLGSAAVYIALGIAGGGINQVRAQGASGQKAAAQGIQFNIPAQGLGSALTSFADRAGLKLLFPSSLVAGKSSPGLSGQLSRQQGLSRLLAGTGLSYQFTSANTVTIIDPSAGGNGAAATVPGAIALDTIDVSGGNASAGMTPDTPYQTPGSSSHISRETLDRVPPISPGDVFINTPGVINAGNRVGTSINPNIRGMQGMGRVNSTIDGARQTTSTYRGYTGNRDETYVDPDMVGGVDISKGPSDGVGVGGIGGSINFRTLDAHDIVKDGETTGSRIKTTMGSNGVAPRDVGTTVGADRPSFYGDTLSGSFATAVIKDNYESIVAYSKRKQGNYFAGTKVPDGIVFGAGTVNPNAQIRPGTEVFNTSEETESLLAKGKVKGEEQSLELSYLYYGSKAGQVSDNFLVVNSTNQQYALQNIEVDTYTAKYRYTPTDNPFVNFRANLWMSDIESDRFLATIDKPYGTRTVGGDIGNTSVITTALGKLTLDNGAEFVREHATAEQFASSITAANGWGTWGPSGVRLMTSAFSKASLDATDWLTVSGGARYDHYNSEGEGFLTRFPERSDSRVSPHAGVVLTPLEGVQLYGQYTEGFRPPSLRETHWNFQDVLFNNPDLSPEIAKNKEVGLNILREDVARSGDKLRFKASLFDNHYDDYILRARIPSRPSQGNRYAFSNIDSATYRGYELSGSYDARTFFFEGAFTKYTKIEYCLPNGTCSAPSLGAPLFGSNPRPGSAISTDYVSNYIPPEYSGSFTAGFRAFDEKLTLGARAHFAGVRVGSVMPLTASGSRVGIDVTWPKYQVFDIFGSYAFTEDVTANFSVENITDEYYFGALSSVGLPSPGRTVRLGLTRTLDGDAFPSVPDLTLGRAAAGTPGSDWTGLYVGGHLGYGFASIKGETTAGNGTPGGIPATESANIDLDEQLRGFQVGVNYEFGNRLVIGVEGDLSWAKHSGTQQAIATEGTLGQRNWLQAETDYDFDWMATLRGRVGYAFDRFLAYGTGGVAFLDESQLRTQYVANFSKSPPYPNPFGTETAEAFKESAARVRTGWVVGGGFEYALTNHWSLSGEYQYADFGVESAEFPGALAGVAGPTQVQVGTRPNPRPGGQPIPIFGTVPGSSQTVNGRKASDELDLHTLKIGINYRF
jgi:hemoglobin/transferrin/lactoferrin receptor protein